MSTLTPATHGPLSRAARHEGSSLVRLPHTPLGWIAAGAAFAHLTLVTIMSRTVLGLPTWLDFTLGLVPGALATVLLVMAMTRGHEHSWLLWLAAASVLWSFGGWLVFAGMAFL